MLCKPESTITIADRELMRLSLALEALLADWIELKRRSEERDAAIEAAVKKATGVSDEDDTKYRVQSIAGAFGGEVSPAAKDYFAVRRQIEERFPETDDDEWERVTAPLEIIIEQVLSIRPETFVGLGVQARALQYIWWDRDTHPEEDEYAKLRHFLADAMALAGLPGPMVTSSNLDADAFAFTRLFGEKLAAKIDKHDHDWFEANKKWNGQYWYANGGSDSHKPENRRKWAEEALREAKFVPRLTGPG
jgi:hypothetical protein